MLCRTPCANMLHHRFSIVWAIGWSLLGSAAAAGAEEANRPADTVRIGIVATQFRDVPAAMVQVSFQPFRSLIEAQTGLRGEFTTATDAEDLAAHLLRNQVDLGVFHGVEFAWVRQKCPQLRPLTIAVNQKPYLRAYLIVHKDSKAVALGDLRGKSLALPRLSRQHCHLFLERQCQAWGQEPQGFFGAIHAPFNVEEALDDVVDGALQAVVVDGIAWDCYQRRKPGRFAVLRELQQSEVFPATVVAYRAGALDEAMLRRFQEGMIQANQSARGKQVFMLWKMTGFEPIPADYEQTLADIVKAYPPPARFKPVALSSKPR